MCVQFYLVPGIEKAYNDFHELKGEGVCVLISLGDLVQMRKSHPCGSAEWVVVRTGADIKIKCQGCGRVVMLERGEFEKRLKKIVRRAGE